MNMKDKIKVAVKFLVDAVTSLKVWKVAMWFMRNRLVSFLLMTVIILSYFLVQQKIDLFIAEFHRLNTEQVKEEEEEEGLTFQNIGDNLWTLTGTVAAGDCEKIIPNMPETFTVILESPGGNLAEGSCIASHLKIRNVITVIRGTPVFDDQGKEIYTPGTIAEGEYEGTTMCASACSLFFIAGDKRYLIGDVLLGIHGPSTPPEYAGMMNPQQLEASAYKTASSLMQLLERLEVDEALRLLFIQIPGNTMYWLNPRDFDARPALITLATNYRDFWEFTAANPDAVY